MRRITRPRAAVVSSALLLAVAVTACEPAPPPWQVSLITVNAAGTAAGNGSSYGAVLSPDGTKLAFLSHATDLVEGGTTGGVFLRDLATGTTTQISPGMQDPEFSPDSSKILMIVDKTAQVYDIATATTTTVTASTVTNPYPDFIPVVPPVPGVAAAWGADGNTIVFSTPMALVPEDTQGCESVVFNGVYAPIHYSCPDVYVHDLTTGTDTLVSVSADGTSSGNAHSSFYEVPSYEPFDSPAFSPDGTRYVFASDATNLTPEATPGIFVRDLAAGTTRRIPGDPGRAGRFSPDGSKVLFFAGALPGQVYLYDVATETTSLVSVNAAGTGAGDRGVLPGAGFTPDGSEVVFGSRASDLVVTDSNEATDIFVRDLVAGTTRTVTANAAGTDTGNGSSYLTTRIRPDGKLVFMSSASDLTDATDTNLASDVFVHDLVTGATTLVTVNAAGTDTPNGSSSAPRFSPDGTKIGFQSDGSDFGPRDDNNEQDGYVHDLVTGTTHLVSARPDGSGSGNGRASTPQFTDDDTVFFESSATDLGPTIPPDSLENVYLGRLRGADLAVGLAADVVGDTIAYQVEVANDGPEDAADVDVLVGLPEGVTLASGACLLDASRPRLVLCEVATLAAHSSTTIEITAAVGAGADPPFDTAALVSSPVLDPDTRNNATAISTG